MILYFCVFMLNGFIMLKMFRKTAVFLYKYLYTLIRREETLETRVL